MMSSNIRIEKICQHCNNKFVAKTTKTKFCGSDCSKKAYKFRKRKEVLIESSQEIVTFDTQYNAVLNSKEFLSLSETSSLLGISRRTIYRLMEREELEFVKLGRRTIIKRSGLDSLFEKSIPDTPKPLKEYKISACYSLREAREKYGLSDSTLRVIIRENEIPTIQDGWYVFVPREILDTILA